jgi:AraC family ethanolamine operon transcriptional activator
MGRSIQINNCSLDSFEGLHQAIQGSHVEVTQLGRGRFRGALSHVGIGDFSLSIGSFSVGVRTQRIATDDKLVVGMLLNASERVTHWSFDMLPADVLVMPPSTEHDGSFHGAAAYAAIRLDLAEVTSLFAGEPRLSNPATWYVKNRYRANSPTGLAAKRRLPQIVSCLARQQAGMPDEVADFWKRSIIDAMAATIVDALPAENRGPVRRRCVWFEMSNTISTRLVPAGAHFGNLRPVRRLAAQPASGVRRHAGSGPVTFLRRKRLCAIHSALRESNPATTTIGEIAMQHGFIELGRFSHYYRSLFGEYPSETLYMSKHISRAIDHRRPLATR